MSNVFISPLTLSPECSQVRGKVALANAGLRQVQGKGDSLSVKASSMGMERLGELLWHSGHSNGCLLATACSFLPQIQGIWLLSWEEFFCWLLWLKTHNGVIFRPVLGFFFLKKKSTFFSPFSQENRKWFHLIIIAEFIFKVGECKKL